MGVRRYEPADRGAVLALAPRLQEGVAAWRDAAAVRRAVEGWVRDAVDSEPRDDRAVFVADQDGVVVGFVGVATTKHFGGEIDCYVGEIVVDEGSEGRGVGRALMEAAEAWARERRLRCVTLETGAANARARRFYAALGFEEEDVKLTKTLRS